MSTKVRLSLIIFIIRDYSSSPNIIIKISSSIQEEGSLISCCLYPAFRSLISQQSLSVWKQAYCCLRIETAWVIMDYSDSLFQEAVL
ncbi:MAG: hypothetical protein ACD_2C00140G0001 [uncultured bacterium (gcode 4)]|uniref:Uncharacterized protein n=1 Tax=uncultured bacterium (gcode 4) TaxID=1234023 RepID=K2FEI8_9BACT|nr:MAG: hypothetical protein ACD_2C00140G0001 [uncultured bacterium (gcode 4)]